MRLTYPPTFAPFRSGVFLTVWMANLISALGTLIQTVAAAWLMTRLTQSADMVALVQTAAALPVLLFSVVAGAIADNFDKRRVMLLAQAFMFVMSTALAVLILIDVMTPWLLLGFLFLIGCGAAFHNPSWFASVVDMVPRTELPAAVSLNAMGNNIARGAGPAFGGLIVAMFGFTMAFMINALSYVSVFVALWCWNGPEPSRRLPREGLPSAVLAGFRYVWLSPDLMKLIIRGFLFSSSAVAVLALLPVLASRSDADNALWFGILFGLFGAGAVVAGLISNAMRAWLSVEWINRLSFVVFGICAAVLPWTMESWVACVITGLAGASWTAALSLIHISVQMAAPRWVTGRAVSIFHMANFGGMALGSWIWGVAAEHSTTQTALYLSAGGLFLGALIGVGRFALPDLVLTDLAPIDRRDDPIRRLEMDARCGPVTINIEYAIAEPDEQAFLVVMQERRRIRRRDGARRWHLSRDINCPTHWVESYQLPTWGDYMHHDRRATLADARIIDQLRHLQSTGKPPVRRCFVHQMTHRAARHNP